MLAFKGAPASFPARKEHRQLHRYIQWSDSISAKVDGYIKENLKGEPYIGVHLRIGTDWVSSIGCWSFSVCLSVCLSLWVCWSVCPCLYLYHQFVCLSVCLTICLSVCLSVCPFVARVSISSVCLSVCLAPTHQLRVGVQLQLRA